ncbi:hypothetical protein HDV01_001795 [Terramyces sp. JEL0728]|nr:hypothetical protein HDV01_001795 [Terramyces sp. JEL0728]
MQSDKQTTPDQYFTSTTPPANLKSISSKVQEFITLNKQKDKRIVLITSGGTTEVDNNNVKVTADHVKELKTIIGKYNKAKSESLLLKINFTTVSEYLFLLKEFTLLLDQMGKMAMFYLAAAVSDFFIPQYKMVEHKIQSSNGGLSLVLDQVPKIIQPLVKEWAKNAFTVSFKLETDSDLLVSKSKGALAKYGHQIVIGNMLHTRKHIVWFIGKDFEKEIRLSDDEVKSEAEIERMYGDSDTSSSIEIDYIVAQTTTTAKLETFQPYPNTVYSPITVSNIPTSSFGPSSVETPPQSTVSTSTVANVTVTKSVDSTRQSATSTSTSTDAPILQSSTPIGSIMLAVCIPIALILIAVVGFVYKRKKSGDQDKASLPREGGYPGDNNAAIPPIVPVDWDNMSTRSSNISNSVIISKQGSVSSLPNSEIYTDENLPAKSLHQSSYPLLSPENSLTRSATLNSLPVVPTNLQEDITRSSEKLQTPVIIPSAISLAKQVPKTPNNTPVEGGTFELPVLDLSSKLQTWSDSGVNVSPTSNVKGIFHKSFAASTQLLNSSAAPVAVNRAEIDESSKIGGQKYESLPEYPRVSVDGDDNTDRLKYTNVKSPQTSELKVDLLISDLLSNFKSESKFLLTKAHTEYSEVKEKGEITPALDEKIKSEAVFQNKIGGRDELNVLIVQDAQSLENCSIKNGIPDEAQSPINEFYHAVLKTSSDNLKVENNVDYLNISSVDRQSQSSDSIIEDYYVETPMSSSKEIEILLEESLVEFSDDCTDRFHSKSNENLGDGISIDFSLDSLSLKDEIDDTHQFAVEQDLLANEPESDNSQPSILAERKVAAIEAGAMEISKEFPEIQEFDQVDLPVALESVPFTEGVESTIEQAADGLNGMIPEKKLVHDSQDIPPKDTEIDEYSIKGDDLPLLNHDFQDPQLYNDNGHISAMVELDSPHELTIDLPKVDITEINQKDTVSDDGTARGDNISSISQRFETEEPQKPSDIYGQHQVDLDITEPMNKLEEIYADIKIATAATIVNKQVEESENIPTDSKLEISPKTVPLAEVAYEIHSDKDTATILIDAEPLLETVFLDNANVECEEDEDHPHVLNVVVKEPAIAYVPSKVQISVIEHQPAMLAPGEETKLVHLMLDEEDTISVGGVHAQKVSSQEGISKLIIVPVIQIAADSPEADKFDKNISQTPSHYGNWTLNLEHGDQLSRSEFGSNSIRDNNFAPKVAGEIEAWIEAKLKEPFEPIDSPPECRYGDGTTSFVSADSIRDFTTFSHTADSIYDRKTIKVKKGLALVETQDPTVEAQSDIYDADTVPSSNNDQAVNSGVVDGNSSFGVDDDAFYFQTKSSINVSRPPEMTLESISDADHPALPTQQNHSTIHQAAVPISNVEKNFVTPDSELEMAVPNDYSAASGYISNEHEKASATFEIIPQNTYSALAYPDNSVNAVEYLENSGIDNPLSTPDIADLVTDGQLPLIENPTNKFETGSVAVVGAESLEYSSTTPISQIGSVENEESVGTPKIVLEDFCQVNIDQSVREGPKQKSPAEIQIQLETNDQIDTKSKIDLGNPTEFATNNAEVEELNAQEFVEKETLPKHPPLMETAIDFTQERQIADNTPLKRYSSYESFYTANDTFLSDSQSFYTSRELQSDSMSFYSARNSGSLSITSDGLSFYSAQGSSETSNRNSRQVGLNRIARDARAPRFSRDVSSLRSFSSFDSIKRNHKNLIRQSITPSEASEDRSRLSFISLSADETNIAIPKELEYRDDLSEISLTSQQSKATTKSFDMNQMANGMLAGFISKILKNPFDIFHFGDMLKLFAKLLLVELTAALNYSELTDLWQTLPNTYTLFEDSKFQYTFKWNVTNVGSADEQIYGALTLVSTVPNYLDYSWIGLGFAETMRQAQSIVCHNYNGTVVFHQHTGQPTYLAPYLDVPNTNPLVGIAGYVDSATHACVFKRPTHPANTYYRAIDVVNTIPMIWAFRPKNPDLNYRGTHFKMHEINHMGSLRSQLNAGQIIQSPIRSNTVAKIHGLGLGVVWFGIFPAGVYVARYCKSQPWWLVFKVRNQVFGVVAAIVLILINVVYMSQITYPIHQIFGFSMGINIIYPFIEPNDSSPWIAYIVICAFWLAVFIITEIYYQFKISNESYIPTLTKANKISITQDPQIVKTSSIKGIKSKKEKNNDNSLAKYTWESLGNAILEGKLLVVANGKYVIDISKWINSHPGGQIILQTVAGTDISSDYYLESGFDAENFIPKKLVPSRKLERTPSQTNMNKSFDGINLDEEMKASSNFSKKEWKLIQAARKTHVHSKLAIQRLSQLTVGEISTASKERVFDPYEFRRYALTEIETLKEDPEAVSIFKFCLLYPYDTRVSEPTIFLPGQHIEILIKVGGEWVLRRYTPTAGNLTSVELVIKKAPYGKMTSALFSAFPGEGQFRIRGPFGIPFFRDIPMPPKENKFNDPPAKINYGVDHVIFIAGGSGITPFIQLINQALLPIDVPIDITEKYTPQKSDELKVNPGDNVHVKYHYLDGWCFGMNLTTNKAGTFPVRCTKPRQSTKINLLAVCASPNDYIGVDLVEGAKIGFPDYLKVFQFNKNTVTDIPKALSLQNFANQSKRVIICGPPEMCSAVSDVLQSNQAAIGLDWQNVSILE